jgi:hypothetical protein
MDSWSSWRSGLRALLGAGRLSWRERREIAASGLFDRKWYLANTPGAAGSGLDPLDHYSMTGWREGFSPSPQFDSAWYRLRYNDVAAADVDPLVHFIRYGKSAGRLPRPSATDLLDDFQSLGTNCEFGFVQRHFNCRVLSLFGFATTSPTAMLDLLESDDDGAFAGTPESLELSIADNGEYMIDVNPHGFRFHTHLSSTTWSADQARSHELTRLRFLWRKLKEDLEEGGRIFVLKARSTMPRRHAVRLASALRRRAVNHLLWMIPVEGRTRPGSVEVTNFGNGLMQARIDRFDNDRGLCSVDLWYEACRRAYDLRSRERAASLGAGLRSRSPRGRAR